MTDKAIVSASKIKAIADAIRAKASVTEGLLLDDMPSAIESIEGIEGKSIDYLAQSALGALTTYQNDEIVEVKFPVFINQAMLADVTLGSCRSICSSAFSGCVNLERADILAGGKFRTDCFDGCEKLLTLILRDVSKVTTAEMVIFPAWLGDGGITRSFSRANWNVYGKVGRSDSWSGLRRGAKGAATYIRGTVSDEDNKPVWLFGRYKSSSNTLINEAFVETEEEANVLIEQYIQEFAESGRYIYVPSALIEQYKSATNWTVFANQIRAIEDYPEITGG